jgi:quercetin dioxygenase-like cupin family protein
MSIINVNGENGLLLATFIIKGDHSCLDGVQFHTKPEDQLQVGTLRHRKGKVVTAHTHNIMDVNVQRRVEVIVILKGKVRFDIYDVVEVQSVEIKEGDIAILRAGGHGLEVLEDCEMVEVKQGPYTGMVDDKSLLRR